VQLVIATHYLPGLVCTVLCFQQKRIGKDFCDFYLLKRGKKFQQKRNFDFRLLISPLSE
jgi:hypothetical protein